MLVAMVSVLSNYISQLDITKTALKKCEMVLFLTFAFALGGRGEGGPGGSFCAFLPNSFFRDAKPLLRSFLSLDVLQWDFDFFMTLFILLFRQASCSSIDPTEKASTTRNYGDSLSKLEDIILLGAI